MAEIKYKIVEKSRMKEQIIGQWLKPKGYNLYCCDVSVKMYGLNFMLTFGKFEEFKRYVWERDEQKVEHGTAKAFYMSYENKEEVVQKFILFTQNNWTAEDYGDICHELHHATHLSMDGLGVSYGVGGEEAFAYLQGHLMELVVRALSMLNKSLAKKKKRNKKKRA